MERQYNMRSPAVKRLMKEAQELSEPTEQYHAQPLEDNLFEWHFTIRGPSDTEFGGGIYHGRILLPPEYPMKPPSIMLLTPNGRFETYKKICLSISGYHPESWQPSWSIRTALLAIIGFMPTHGGGAIGSLDYTPEERKVLAKKSQDWKCHSCGDVIKVLKAVTKASEKTQQEAKELASQINFQAEKQSTDSNNTEQSATENSSKEAPVSSSQSNSTQSPPVTQAQPGFPQMPFPSPFPFPLQPRQGNQAASRFARPGFSTFPWPPSGRGMPGWPMMPPWFPRMPGIPGVPQVGNATTCQHAVPPTSSSTNNSSSSGTRFAPQNAAQNIPAAAAAVNNSNVGLRQRQQEPTTPRAPTNIPAAPTPTVVNNTNRPTRQSEDWSLRMYMTVIGIALCILVLLFRRLIMMGL
ncbi:ubiquitin-conjugating enzyme E2 J1-like [Gigantopelta aegis]|uniref:ubiquitin-conjugating enzyme E2 J1-like n=1 Tax=Gigantopelta aegis TaxID=1735272 RepID=UPI001B887A3E|nr:ubiquitin-conjugating enzyme E2 J1-like [Gigantopelta aegis]